MSSSDSKKDVFQTSLELEKTDSDVIATLVLHLVFATQSHAEQAGMHVSRYGAVKFKGPEMFQNKEAFLGSMIPAIEKLYDYLKSNRSDPGESHRTTSRSSERDGQEGSIPRDGPGDAGV